MGWYRPIEPTFNVGAFPFDELNGLGFMFGDTIRNYASAVLQVFVSEEHLDDGVEVQQLQQHYLQLAGEGICKFAGTMSFLKIAIGCMREDVEELAVALMNIGNVLEHLNRFIVIVPRKDHPQLWKVCRLKCLIELISVVLDRHRN